ncbi:hypothetical protein LCGC14_2698830, partial [marine sediment metagenome]
MKTIILAGGYGTRLDQLTEIIPKPMVYIGNKPVLWHIMKIYSHFGFNDFIIALGVKQHVIKEYFYNFEIINNDFTIDIDKSELDFHNRHNETNWKVTLVDTGLNTLKGGRIKRLEKYLDDDINMITYGDGVGDININELVDYHKSHGKTLTLTGVHPTARFGEIKEKGGEVLSFSEKPKTSQRYVNGGFMVFNNNMLGYLTEDEDCDYEYGIIEDLAKKGEVMMYKHNG